MWNGRFAAHKVPAMHDFQPWGNSQIGNRLSRVWSEEQQINLSLALQTATSAGVAMGDVAKKTTAALQ